MIKPDKQLYDWIVENEVISPAVNRKVRYDEYGNVIISKGLSEAGYDISFGNVFSVYRPLKWWQKIISLIQPDRYVLDPRNPPPLIHTHVRDGDYYILKPRSNVLATTKESFSIPNDHIGIYTGKSSWLRIFVISVISPLEPGWRGKGLTVEISNLSDRAVKIYPNWGIGQIVFFGLESEVSTSYRGNYQDQSKLPTATTL